MLVRIKREDAGVVALIAQSLNVDVHEVEVGETTILLSLGRDVALNTVFINQCRDSGLLAVH